MDHYKTSADIGSVLIGNEDWAFAVPNRGGDGKTDVFVATPEDLHEENGNTYILDKKRGRYNLHYISSVYGKFGIYPYDCAFSEKDGLKHPMTILEGRYWVYNGEYCVVFVKAKKQF